MFAYVYGPVCFLILSDVVFFVMTTILIRRAGIGSSNRHSKEKYRSVLFKNNHISFFQSNKFEY